MHSYAFCQFKKLTLAIFGVVLPKLVVGDDRQTVLQKESVIDDYLFRDHELDEHLRSTQARGFKGGGSHIFALVKAIKQASVLLDEHYRCPADIIEFSNKFVYDGELNVMQWRLPEHDAAVVVEYSEQSIEKSKKPTSGKFKLAVKAWQRLPLPVANLVGPHIVKNLP